MRGNSFTFMENPCYLFIWKLRCVRAEIGSLAMMEYDDEIEVK